MSAPSFRGLRAPWRRGPWSAQEVALALHGKREELCREFARRSDARGLGAAAHGEVVDEAICAVVMMRGKVLSEEHLLGAFWTSVRLVARHHREGRRSVRVGARQRVDFEKVTDELSGGPEPEEVVELLDRMARAADFMSSLDELEQRVIVAMAVHGGGFKLTAHRLGLPIGTVRAAIRSGEMKLEQVAVIAAAGRMCGFREPAIHAHAAGTARQAEEHAARVHIAACRPCRDSYVRLAREMRTTGFQRHAAAAFLPLPLLTASVRQSPLERLFAVLGGHPVSGTSAERTAGLLGGGGLAKAAATGAVILTASAGIGARVLHTLAPPTPAHHHLAAGGPTDAIHASRPGLAVSPYSRGRVMRPDSVAQLRRPERPSHPPPSRSLGFLALGRSAGGGTSASRPPVTTTASTSSTGSASEAPAPSHSGGRTSLGYLGR